MRVKKLIEWLSEDFQPDDSVVVMVWGKDLFHYYDPDTDTEMPLTEETWREAVESTEEDRRLEYASETVHDTIQDYIQRPERTEVTA